MDTATLLAHRDHSVSEPSRVTSALSRLTAREQATFAALRDDVHGRCVRLEQERIRFGLVERVLRG